MASYSEPKVRDDRAFWAFVRASARRRSDGALAMITGVGLIGLTMVGMYAQSYWRPGLVFVVMATFGGWGIFDRSAIQRRWLSKTARLSFAIIGGFAAAVVLFSAIEFVLFNIRQ